MYDIDGLKELIKILEESQLSALEISDKNGSVYLEKAVPAGQVTQTVIPTDCTAPAVSAPVPSRAVTGKTIKSPMVGVFYSASGPDNPPFVSVGQPVKKGDVVCIIEAMKIMNEITAEEDGTITEILVENGEVVEFDQPLFKIG